MEFIVGQLKYKLTLNSLQYAFIFGQLLPLIKDEELNYFFYLLKMNKIANSTGKCSKNREAREADS